MVWLFGRDINMQLAEPTVGAPVKAKRGSVRIKAKWELLIDRKRAKPGVLASKVHLNLPDLVDIVKLPDGSIGIRASK